MPGDLSNHLSYSVPHLGSAWRAGSPGSKEEGGIHVSHQGRNDVRVPLPHHIRCALRWIISAPVPRMAAADTAHAAVSTAQGTVLAHGGDEVLAATWLEATDRRHNRTQ